MSANSFVDMKASWSRIAGLVIVSSNARSIADLTAGLATVSSTAYPKADSSSTVYSSLTVHSTIESSSPNACASRSKGLIAGWLEGPNADLIARLTECSIVGWSVGWIVG